MKSIYAFFIVSLLSMTLLSCANDSTDDVHSESAMDTETGVSEEDSTDSYNPSTVVNAVSSFPADCQFDYAPEVVDTYDLVNGEWVLDLKEQYIYDERGLPATWQGYSTSDDSTELELNTEATFLYDDQGRFVELLVCSGTSDVCYSKIYEYNDSSPLSNRSYLDYGDEIHELTEYVYKNSQLASMATGQFMTGSDAASGSIIEYEYDESGRMTRQVETDSVILTITTTDETDSEETTTSSHSMQYYRVDYTYSDVGELIHLSSEWQNSDDEWDIDSTIDYTWTDGRLIEVNKHEDMETSQLTFDSAGRLVSILYSRQLSQNDPLEQSRRDMQFTDTGNSCFFERFSELGLEFDPFIEDILMFYGQGETNLFVSPAQ